MVTCSVQTYEPFVESPAQKTSPRYTPTQNYESFETDKYLTGRTSSNRPEPVRMMKSRPEHDFSRLEGKNRFYWLSNFPSFWLDNIFSACLSDKRDEIKDLRHQLREKEEAFARQNAEIQILKRQLRDQERDFNRARRQSSNPALQMPSNDKHDIAINLQDGNQDDYGKIEQVIFHDLLTSFDPSHHSVTRVTSNDPLFKKYFRSSQVKFKNSKQFVKLSKTSMVSQFPIRPKFRSNVKKWQFSFNFEKFPKIFRFLNYL